MFRPAEARALLLLITKSRALVMLDDSYRYARSPFAYQKRFFKRLRPDQVPRFLRCLTDPQKLPTRVFKLDELYTLQNRVDVDKVEAIRSSPTASKIIVVKIDDGEWTIADGLHRASADWLDHNDEVVAHYADLTDDTRQVEPVPGAGRFDTAEERERMKVS